eukprot:1447969-Rhodomonas_salina.1
MQRSRASQSALWGWSESSPESESEDADADADALDSQYDPFRLLAALPVGDWQGSPSGRASDSTATPTTRVVSGMSVR